MTVDAFRKTLFSPGRGHHALAFHRRTKRGGSRPQKNITGQKDFVIDRRHKVEEYVRQA